MKYIKIFENRYEKKIDFKYLNKEDTEKIKKFITDFFIDSNFINEINNLEWSDFVDGNFDYRNIFDNITTSKYYTKGNIFYEVDKFCQYNNIYSKLPALRNSMYNILNDIYNKYNPEFENGLDTKLIEIFEKNPKKYKKKYSLYSDMFTNKVKAACKWMLDYRKYNL